jgi:Tfp pilus assembly protein PilO
MTLLRRILAERRRTVYILVGGVVVNVLVFAFLVYPLRAAVANVEQRTQSAEQAEAAAKGEFTTANGLLTGKDRAQKELSTFYTSVLAPDLAGARRLTYARLARLAEDTSLDYEQGTYKPVSERGSTLTKFVVTMDLRGEYSDIRNFIHEIETAPEFVVIDNVSLSEGTEGDGSLRLKLDLSTYFWTGGLK